MSDLFGGITDLIGGILTNRSNQSIARGQEAFQERMRNTAYQAAVADMNKAGINPMLAIQQGGAAAPSGASIPMQNPVTPAISSAMEIASTQANVNKTAADTDLSKALTLKAASDSQAALASAAASRASANVTTAHLPAAQVEGNIYSINIGVIFGCYSLGFFSNSFSPAFIF